MRHIGWSGSKLRGCPADVHLGNPTSLAEGGQPCCHTSRESPNMVVSIGPLRLEYLIVVAHVTSDSQSARSQHKRRRFTHTCNRPLQGLDWNEPRTQDCARTRPVQYRPASNTWQRCKNRGWATQRKIALRHHPHGHYMCKSARGQNNINKCTSFKKKTSEQ